MNMDMDMENINNVQFCNVVFERSAQMYSPPHILKSVLAVARKC